MTEHISTVPPPMGKGPQRRKNDPVRRAEQAAAYKNFLAALERLASTGLVAAKALDVSPSLVSEVREQTKPVGPKMARGIANVLKISLDEVWGRPAPARTVYRPERYPNLEKAILRMADADADAADAVERLRGVAGHWPSDLSVGAWEEQIEEMRRSIRRARKTGDAIGGRPDDDEDDTPPAGRNG